MEQNYIKVRPNVAQALGLDTLRTTLPDGCYTLYWPDLLALPGAGWGNYIQVIEWVGGKVMTPREIEAEQHGGYPAPLPTPTDTAWIPATNES